MVSLAQILLDPYYRTIRGLETLIEKEWCSYGFRFRQRDGLGKAENSECSPIFLQFIDAIFQIMLQFPCSFEYSEAFLIAVIDELYASRTGTFLSISERERGERMLANKTLSLWTLLDNDKEPMHYMNPLYRTRQSSNVLTPKTGTSHIIFWKGFYLRHGSLEVDQLGLGIQNITVPMNLYQAPLPANEQNRARAISTNVAITKAVVTKSFEAEEDDQLSLHEGQEIYVLEESTPQFWFVSTTPSRLCVGYFPKDNLRIIKGRQLRNTRPKESWVSASHSKTQNQSKFLLHPDQQQQGPLFLGARNRTATTVDAPTNLNIEKEVGHSRSKSDSETDHVLTDWEDAKQKKFLRPQRPMFRENTVTVVVKWKVFPQVKKHKKHSHQAAMPTHATFMSSSSSNLPFIASPKSPSIMGVPTSPAMKFTNVGQSIGMHKRNTSSHTSSNLEAASPVRKTQNTLPSIGTPPGTMSPFNLIL